MLIALPISWVGACAAAQGWGPLLDDAPHWLSGDKASWGAMLLGGACFFVWTRGFAPITRLHWADLAVMGLCTMALWLRIGCASVHDHLGPVAATWWPLSFDDAEGIPRHDLGLYEAGLWAVLLAAAWRMFAKGRPGATAATVLVGYGVGRALIAGSNAGATMTPGQCAALGVAVIGSLLWWHGRARPASPCEETIRVDSHGPASARLPMRVHSHATDQP